MKRYEAGKRINIDLTLTKVCEVPNYFGYHVTTDYIYIFKDSGDNTLIWKTSCVIGMDDDNSDYGWIPVRRGDKINVMASIKGESEYKGEPQIIITRVKVKKIVERALTKADKIRFKRIDQMTSLQDGDFLWEIPYSRYKKHYSDCETLAGSYIDHDQNDYPLKQPLITVIIRKGRLKPSGTRFKHYSGYEFKNEHEHIVCYRAVCEENAKKRAEKDFPNCTWKLNHIYKY